MFKFNLNDKQKFASLYLSMRFVLAVTLVLLTIIGSFSRADSSYFSQHKTKTITIADSNINSTNSDAPCEESDCHHEGSLCHNCHIGHCALLVSIPFNLSISIKQIQPTLGIDVLPQVYLSAPFRPPIV